MGAKSLSSIENGDMNINKDKKKKIKNELQKKKCKRENKYLRRLLKSFINSKMSYRLPQPRGLFMNVE